MLTGIFHTNIWTMINLLIVHGLFFEKQNLYKRVLPGAAMCDIENLQPPTFSLNMYKACTLTMPSLKEYFKRRTNDLLTPIMSCNMFYIAIVMASAQELHTKKYNYLD